ncbi:MAG TPA: hypothetical protein VJA18_01995 [Candidatus Nanoarchaeia archaeon]|nr:hypothetical protein [Candidatus Nanoarchaeia archaeon]
MRKLLSIMALFVISLLTVSMVSAAPSTLGGLNTSYGSVKIEVNDEKDDSTLLSVEEGEELDVEVELAIGSDDADATYDMDGNPDYVPGDLTARNIEVEARLSGYEDKDVVENVLVSKVTEGTKKTVKLKLLVPNDFQNGKATLRVLVFGGNDVIADKTYELFVESPSHSVEIADVSFSPSLTVKAGRSLLATVLLENVGEENEEDVKVTVAIPDLGLSASEYVDELNADDREDVDEMFLQIPADTPAGDYEVKVTAQYDDLDESVTETYTLKVLANELLAPKTGKLVLAVGPEMQTVAAGKTASYAVALTNEGSASKAYTLEVATGDWATASVSESLVVLEPGKNKVVYVDVAAKEDATAGEHLASVTVKSGSDVLETVVLKANVVQDAGADGSASLRNGLEIALIVLVVLLVLMGLVIGFSRLRKDDEGEEKYY